MVYARSSGCIARGPDPGPVHSVPIFRSGEQFTYTQHYNICYGCKDEDF